MALECFSCVVHILHISGGVAEVFCYLHTRNHTHHAGSYIHMISFLGFGWKCSFRAQFQYVWHRHMSFGGWTTVICIWINGFFPPVCLSLSLQSLIDNKSKLHRSLHCCCDDSLLVFGWKSSFMYLPNVENGLYFRFH